MVLITGLLVPAAQGQTFYTDRNLWLAAVTNVSTQALEGLAPAGTSVINFNLSGGISVQTFSGGGSDVYAESKTYASGKFSLNGTDDLRSTFTASNSKETIFSLTSNPTAIGIDTGFRSFTSGPEVQSQTVGIYTSGSFAIGSLFDPGAFATGFVGVVYTGPIGQIRFFPSSNGVVNQVFDNISTATAATTTSTPEPGSLALLIGLGISGAGFLVRRRRRVS